MKKKHLAFCLGSACAFFVMATTADAASYKRLVAKGYGTGQMTRSGSGGLGWVVSNGKESYFCKMKATLAYVSKTRMVSFTAAGRQIELDRKVFEKSMGGRTGRIPNLSDLEAGRLHPDDVGSCRRLK